MTSKASKNREAESEDVEQRAGSRLKRSKSMLQQPRSMTETKTHSTQRRSSATNNHDSMGHVSNKCRHYESEQFYDYEIADGSNGERKSKSVDRRGGRGGSQRHQINNNNDDRENSDDECEKQFRSQHESSSNKTKQFYERLLESKETELVALRITHQRRLERLISLEKEHKLLLEHVEALEEAAATTNKSGNAAADLLLPPNAVKMKLIGENDHQENNNGQKRSGAADALDRARLVVGGYKRKDGESMWNEVKLLRAENVRLKADNLRLKEACDLFEVKLSEKMEEVEALQLELNVNLNERQAQFGATKVVFYSFNTRFRLSFQQ